MNREDTCYEAAVRLQEQLRTEPLVTAVSVGYQREREDWCIVVTTLLSESEKLSVVPTEFDGFAIFQVGIREIKARYMELVRKVIGLVADLEHPIIKEICFDFDQRLRESNSALYVETPFRWIPQKLLERLDYLSAKQQRELRYELQESLMKLNVNRVSFPIDDPEFDWDEAGRRVRGIFQKHGIALPLFGSP